MKNKKKQGSNLYKYGVIYFGTSLMMISPFIIDSVYGKMGMMLGLLLITIQTQKTKQYNLSLLNLVGFSRANPPQTAMHISTIFKTLVVGIWGVLDQF